MSHQSQCVSNPETGQSPEATHHPPWLYPQPGFGLGVASHSISGLAQAQPSCHSPSVISPVLPKVPRQGPSLCWTQAYMRPSQRDALGGCTALMAPPVWSPRCEDWYLSSQPPPTSVLASNPVLGTPCQIRQLEKGPTSPATPAVAGHPSDQSLMENWELAAGRGWPWPHPPTGLVLKAGFGFPSPRTILSR